MLSWILHNDMANVKRSISSYLGKRILPDKLQSFCRVGVAPSILDLVNGCQKRGFVCVLVQPELVLRRCVEGSDADVDTVSTDVKVVGEGLDKVPYLGEFRAAHTA